MKYSTRLMLCSIFSFHCLAQPYRIGTVAGGRPVGDGGPATDAALLFPSQIAVDNSGNLYIAGKDNNRVRRVTPGGVIGTVAGSGFAGFAGDGSQAVSARLYRPSGVALDSAGNLYIADTLNHRIRRVGPSGVITTFAGTGVAGYGGDGGPAGSAQLNAPVALAADGAGNLYIADRDNHRVRRVDSAGTIASVAGNGRPDYSGDGDPLPPRLCIRPRRSPSIARAPCTSPTPTTTASAGSPRAPSPLSPEMEHRARRATEVPRRPRNSTPRKAWLSTPPGTSTSATR